VNLSYALAEERFRAELRAWLEANPPGPEPEQLGDWVAYGKSWQRRPSPSAQLQSSVALHDMLATARERGTARDLLAPQGLAAIVVEAHAMRYTAYRKLTRALRGEVPGHAGSIEKLHTMAATVMICREGRGPRSDGLGRAASVSKRGRARL